MNIASLLKAKGRAVATARQDATLLDIASQLSSKGIGAIVVVNERDEVIGIVSERDLVKTIGARGAGSLSLPVGEVMTQNVITCTEDRTIEDLMGIMTSGRFRHVPVVEGGRLVGIISIGDVVKNHIAAVEMEVSAMRDYLSTG
ncbi:MAG: CBS domain-containing protein [Filomicrobium sp.]